MEEGLTYWCRAKADMGTTKDPFLKAVYNGRQLALKVGCTAGTATRGNGAGLAAPSDKLAMQDLFSVLLLLLRRLLQLLLLPLGSAPLASALAPFLPTSMVGCIALHAPGATASS
jgi:hypothetical protein